MLSVDSCWVLTQICVYVLGYQSDPSRQQINGHFCTHVLGNKSGWWLSTNQRWSWSTSIQDFFGAYPSRQQINGHFYTHMLGYQSWWWLSTNQRWSLLTPIQNVFGFYPLCVGVHPRVRVSVWMVLVNKSTLVPITLWSGFFLDLTYT